MRPAAFGSARCPHCGHHGFGIHGAVDDAPAVRVQVIDCLGCGALLECQHGALRVVCLHQRVSRIAEELQGGRLAHVIGRCICGHRVIRFAGRTDWRIYAEAVPMPPQQWIPSGIAVGAEV